MNRAQLPTRRQSENFTFEVDGLCFTATASHFPNGDLAELFLNNHKNGAKPIPTRAMRAILLSFALQYGADVEVIRRALCRDSHDRALGPVGAALDLLTKGGT